MKQNSLIIYGCNRKTESSRCIQKIDKKSKCPILLGEDVEIKKCCQFFLRRYFRVNKGWYLICKDGNYLHYKSADTPENIKAVFPGYNVI